MLLSADEIAMLTAACSDRNNQKAVELVNLMGTQSGAEIARQIVFLPKTLKTEIEKHVRETIDEQKRRSRAR